MFQESICFEVMWLPKRIQRRKENKKYSRWMFTDGFGEDFHFKFYYYKLYKYYYK